jgi:hypothetical protein
MTKTSPPPEQPTIDFLGGGPPYPLGSIVGNAVAQRIATVGKGRLHVETFLCSMGAIAGFAAQMGLREELIGKQKKSEKDVFTLQKTPGGSVYFGGASLQALLTSSTHSVFYVIAGAIQQVAGTDSASGEMAKSVVRSVLAETDAEYGLSLNVAEYHLPHLKPIEALKIFWSQAYAELSTMSELSGKVSGIQWAYEIAACISKFITTAKAILPPSTDVFELVLRPAIAMGRLNPEIIVKHIKDNKLEWNQLGRPNEKLDYPIYR